MTVLYIIIGIFIGLLISFIHNMYKSAYGVLRIDHSNPKKDLYKFEINDLTALDKKTRITLKIDHKADLSPK